ncbi:hypothetical protein ACWDSL_03875 [Streptomyces sp. NPDC000941]
MAGFTLTVAMRAEVRDLIAGTRAASGQMRTLADRTDAAHRSLARLDASGVRLASQFAALNRSVRSAVGELNRISARASAARASLRATGDDGARSMSRLQRAMAGVGRRGISTTNLLAGGGLLLGAGEMVEEGNRYQRQMNLFRAVNDATAAQMKRAAVVAQELGNDLRPQRLRRRPPRLSRRHALGRVGRDHRAAPRRAVGCLPPRLPGQAPLLTPPHPDRPPRAGSADSERPTAP